MDRSEVNISPAEFAQANRLGREMQSTTPRAASARYNRRIDRVVIQLSTGIDLAFPPHIAQGLENATPAQLAEIEISPSGFGIHFPRLGAQGGKSTSPAKTAAAKRNGRNGGRPKKRTAAVA